MRFNGFNNGERWKCLNEDGMEFIPICCGVSQFKNQQWYPTMSLAGLFLYNNYMGNWNNLQILHLILFALFFTPSKTTLDIVRFLQWQTWILNSRFCMCIITLGHDNLLQISGTTRSGGVYAILRFRRWSPVNRLGIAIHIKHISAYKR